MNLIDYAYNLFQGIKQKDYSFASAMNKKINEMSLSNSEISVIKDAFKGFINKYYYIRYEISSRVNIEDKNELDYLVVAFAFAKYARNFTLNDTINMINESYVDNNFTFDVDKIKEVFEGIISSPIKIDEKYETNLIKKLSLKYSYPEWLVGMIKKHYGSRHAYKSISSSRMSAPICVSINKAHDEVKLDETLFSKNELCATSYDYIGKEPLIKIDAFKKHDVYVMDLFDQKVCEVVDATTGDNILLIGKDKQTLACSLSLSFYDFGKVNYASKTTEGYYNAKKLIDQFGIKSCSVCESDLNLLCTYFKYDDMDKVIVLPPNSQFGLIRRKPEILINFNQNELDDLIKNQREYIKEASRYVKKGGYLIYAVPTLNLKEANYIVNGFMMENENFELVEEDTIFPYSNHATGMYYAKLKRNEDEVSLDD